MVDLSKWNLTDAFTGLQAACLWCEVSPVSTMVFLASHDKDRVGGVMQAFTAALVSGKLRGDTASNPRALIGNHESTFIAREELMRFAETMGERPRFLFDTILPASASEVAAESPDGPKKKPGRPQEHDWNGFYAEIVRVADMEELPATQADLVRQMLFWFSNHYDGRQPAESEVKKRIGDIYRGLKATGWEPRGPKMKR